MKHKKINTIILATALTVAGITHAATTSTEPVVADAQESSVIKEGGHDKHHGGKHHGDHKQKKMNFKNLDLSDAQKQQMKTIMTSYKEASKTLKEAHKAEMKALMQSATFDEAKAKQLISQREAQRADQKLDMLKMKHEMYQVLTDEQKAQYDERQMKKMKRHNR